MGKGKRFLSFSLLFLLLLTGTLFLAYKFILPTLIKYVVEDRLEKGLKKEVSLGKVDFSLFRGMEFHRLLICEPGKEEKIFLQVGELKIDYRIDEILDNLKDKGRDFRKWQLTLEASSPEIIFQGFRLDNFYLPLRLKNSRLIIKDLKAGLYGGNLNSRFDLNLGSEQKDYRLQVTLSQADLSRLGEKGSSAKKKKFKGILSASLNLEGTAGKLKNLNGCGEVSMVEGSLWEFPLLGGLMTFLHVPSLEKVIFREGKAHFTIAEGMVAIEDLTLVSDQVKLLAQGKIDFKGNFRPSLIYRVSFSKGLLGEVPFIGNIISFVIDETGYLLAQVEVTGSLKESKYRLVPLVKGIKDLFRRVKPSN